MTTVLWHEHPALVRLLGLCPLLAVSHRLLDALVIGVVLLVTLLSAGGIVNGLRGFIAAPVRLPLVLLVSAGLVALQDILIQAWLYPVHRSLGIYLPLVAASCLVLAWLEESAPVRSLHRTLADAAAQGCAMLWLLALFALVREPLGHGSLLAGIEALPGLAVAAPVLHFDQPLVPLLAEPAGAFLLMGLALAGYAALTRRRAGSDCCAVTEEPG